MLLGASVHVQFSVHPQMSRQGAQKLHAAIPKALLACMDHDPGHPCTRVCQASRSPHGQASLTGAHSRALFNEAQSLEYRNFSARSMKKRKKPTTKQWEWGRGGEGHSSFFLLTPLAAFGYRISLNGSLHAAFIFKPLIAF